MPQWLKDPPPLVSAGIAIVSARIAVVAATISAGSLFLNWRNYRRDRHDVEVDLKWNAEVVVAEGAPKPTQGLGHITVTNKGRRPVFITFVGLELPGRSRVVN